MIATPQLKLPEEKSWVASRCKAVALRHYYNSFAYDGRFRLDMRRATAAMQLHRATMEGPVSNWADMPVMRCEPYTPPQEHGSSCATATDGYPPALPLREPNDLGLPQRQLRDIISPQHIAVVCSSISSIIYQVLYISNTGKGLGSGLSREATLNV